MAPFDGTYQNLQKTLHIFAPAFTISETVAFKMFDLEKFGHGREVQHSQRCHSISNISPCKSHSAHCYARSHRFREINV